MLERIDDFGGTFGDYSHVDPDDIILPGLGEPLHSMIRRGVNASVAYHRSVTVSPYLRDLVRDFWPQRSKPASRTARSTFISAVLARARRR